MVDKVIRDGKVAVLVSPGYGAGWSSWAHEHEDLALFHPEFVKWVEDGKKDDIDEVVKRVIGSGDDDYIYTGGAHQLRIEWLPVGTVFKIDEYDGSESIETRDGTEWMVA